MDLLTIGSTAVGIFGQVTKGLAKITKDMAEDIEAANDK